MSLPGFLDCRLCRRIELKEARLRSSIEIDAQGVVVLPRDVQPPGLAHDGADAESPALQLRGVVRIEIPGVGGCSGVRVERNAFIVALARRRHAVPPILADDGDPIAREVDGRGFARRGRRRTPLRSRADHESRSENKERCNDRAARHHGHHYSSVR
jgi:hypothetical protein